MNDLAVATLSAFWLGILTSISPCPLATNIAAISYIGQKIGRTRDVLLSGLLYTVGRTVAYWGLALLVIGTALSIPQISRFLQGSMHLILGPLLILVGMFLLELLQVSWASGGANESVRQRADAWGIWGALLLGTVFALSFCPTSAALFFGSLVPLSLTANSRLLLPIVYGIGTALPVVVFAVLLAWSAQTVGKAFNALTKIERAARYATGAAFVGIGIYFTLKYVFEVV